MTTKKTKKKSSAPEGTHETVRSTNMEWCNSVLVTSPVFYSLCTSESAFRRGLKALGATEAPKWLQDAHEGVTHTFDADDVGIALVVCIRPGKDYDYAIRTLVHEAVHVWQAIRDYLQEEKPSAEFEAYSVETIFSNLKDAYDRQVNNKKKK